MKKERQFIQIPWPKQRDCEAGTGRGPRVAGGWQPGKSCLDWGTGPSRGMKAAPLPLGWAHLGVHWRWPSPSSCVLALSTPYSLSMQTPEGKQVARVWDPGQDSRVEVGS